MKLTRREQRAVGLDVPPSRTHMVAGVLVWLCGIGPVLWLVGAVAHYSWAAIQRGWRP